MGLKKSVDLGGELTAEYWHLFMIMLQTNVVVAQFQLYTDAASYKSGGKPIAHKDIPLVMPGFSYDALASGSPFDIAYNLAKTTETIMGKANPLFGATDE